MTIVVGSWVVPTLVTVISFFVCFWSERNDTSSGYDAIGNGAILIAKLGVATIISLLAFLIWSFLR